MADESVTQGASPPGGRGTRQAFRLVRPVEAKCVFRTVRRPGRSMRWRRWSESQVIEYVEANLGRNTGRYYAEDAVFAATFILILGTALLASSVSLSVAMMIMGIVGGSYAVIATVLLPETVDNDLVSGGPEDTGVDDVETA